MQSLVILHLTKKVLKSQEKAIINKNLKFKVMQVYGVVKNGIHNDVSNTERGAKIYATKNGYTEVSVRYNCGYNVQIIAKKVGQKWINQ